ncbi:MAG TPA: hypothetical protein VFL47_15020 [Flavisolibacter sp.]|nr:hypothetical protein [Flavisolibacter sp.]
MRKATAIFFVLLLLLVQTPLQQVLRLPVLLEHLREHQVLRSEISIGTFLVQHYLNGQPKDSDYERDMQLPFRATDILLINSTVVLPAQLEIAFPSTVYGEKTYFLYGPEDLAPRHTTAVFQPPKPC